MHTLNRAAGLAVAGVLALTTPLHAQSFDILFRITSIRGLCEVKKPDAKLFEPATKGKAYPFGTVVRTGADGEAYIILSSDDALRMTHMCELSVFEPDGTVANSNRIVRLESGRIDISTRDGLAEKSLVVETPVATCDGFAGRSNVDLLKSKKPTKDKLDLRLLVHTENGTIRVSGPQFSIPKMKSGSAARIESSADRSLTRIVNESNDYIVNIENGTDTPVALETTTRSTVRICREHAPVGGKLVVAVLETAPDGKGKGNFTFVMGEPSLMAISTNNLPPLLDDRNATGSVVNAISSNTNAPLSIEERLFK